VWQGASPNPVRFLRFNSVGETGEAQRALCTQRSGSSDRKFSRVFVGIIFREENVGHVLTRDSALIVDEAGKLPVGLSLVGHTIKSSGGF
jgi:hypothetical protein